jgi:regulator of cell morphogenesis and NO signaling
MKDIHQTTIGSIVASNYKAAEVFHSYGIDFCCQGNRTLEDACKEEKLDLDKLISDLEQVTKETDSITANYNSWPLDLLVEVIVKKHHKYVEEKIPLIKQFLQKLCDVHGANHPELFEISTLFSDSSDDLTTHMKKEELILFPFIRKLEKAKTEAATPSRSPQFGSVQNPVDMMMEDHAVEGDRFRKINSLSGGYAPPADACNTYRITYEMLKAFEADLHLHIHLENNILFPKSINLERELFKN